MQGMTRTVVKAAALALGLLMLMDVGGVARAQTAATPIRLSVDASQAPQKILHTHMEIPVQSGPLTLYYPEWIPGEHMPDGPIIQMAGMKFSGGGKSIAWRRDLVEMFSIHLDVPAGVSTLEADFDFLLSGAPSGFSAGASATASLDVLSWNQVLLYPKGLPAKDIIFAPSLRLPADWKFGTALPIAKQEGDKIEFAPVALTTLVDSPVISGRYYRAIQLTPGQTPSHEIDIAADSNAALAMTPDTQLQLHNLVAEAYALFGARHYRDYHFLLTLSDDVAHFGLEHHESSDDRTTERSLIDESERVEFAIAAAARIRALLERKIPAAGGIGDTRLPAADEGRLAVGVRGLDRISGRGADGAQRIANAAAVAGRFCGAGSDVRTPAGARLASFAGYGGCRAVSLRRRK